MTILSNSWAQHLNSLAGKDEANKNMTTFTEALAPFMTTSKQLNSLVEEVNAAVLFVGPNNSIHRTHSWAKFGGTQSRPITSIVCLIGTGPRAHDMDFSAVSWDFEGQARPKILCVFSRNDRAQNLDFPAVSHNFLGTQKILETRFSLWFLGISKDGLIQIFLELELPRSFLGILKCRTLPKN
jgi:hypothetical protein